MSKVPLTQLHNGTAIPQLGLGVYQVRPQDTVVTVHKAFEIGYRHIDTAEMYQNEAQVGEAIASANIDRSEIWITSKLNNGQHKPVDARKAFAETLSKLQSDYIDLFLIHWPLPTLYDGDYVSTWKTLEEFAQDGRAKSIGVSNFQVSHLEQLAEQTQTVPVINQIELHPYFQNKEVVEYCAAHDIVVEAWSPIAQGDVLEDETITAIATIVGKTPAQVVLRWHIQKGYVIFPKSVTPERIEENFAIFDFQLSDDHMSQIDSLDKGEAGRRGPNPDTFDRIP